MDQTDIWKINQKKDKKQNHSLSTRDDQYAAYNMLWHVNSPKWERIS